MPSLSGPSDHSRWGWAALFVVLALTLAAVIRQPPEVYTDAATCIWAAAQREAGRVEAWHSVSQPDVDQIAEDRITPLVWWPASYELLPQLWRRVGLSWGDAVRATFVTAWIAGLSGWGLYFRRIVSPRLLPWLLMAFAAFRYSHSNANIYDGGEFLFWAAFPWILLLNIRAMPPVTGSIVGRVVLAGSATAVLVLVKYSAGLCLIGFTLAHVWLAARSRVSWWHVALWIVTAGSVAAILGGAGAVAETNPATVRDNLQWTPLWWGMGAWLFAISDLEILAMKLLVHQWEQPLLPAVGQHGDGQISWLIPIPLGLVTLLWLTRTKRLDDESQVEQTVIRDMAFFHLVGFTAALVLILCSGARVHMDARFLRPAAIAWLPFLCLQLAGAWRDARRWRSAVAAALFAVLLVVPALYGLTTLTYKTWVRGAYASQRTGPAGIRHDMLDTNGDAAALFRLIEEQLPADDGVIYLVDPSLAIPLAHRRVLVEHAHFRTLQHLQRKQYRGRSAGVLVLLPRSFVADGRAAAIRHSFRDVASWKPIDLPMQPNWMAWRAVE